VIGSEENPSVFSPGRPRFMTFIGARMLDMPSAALLVMDVQNVVVAEESARCSVLFREPPQLHVLRKCRQSRFGRPSVRAESLPLSAR
jgi:hypothetical protein